MVQMGILKQPEAGWHKPVCLKQHSGTTSHLATSSVSDRKLKGNSVVKRGGVILMNLRESKKKKKKKKTFFF